jgi:hypothetical protein
MSEGDQQGGRGAASRGWDVGYSCLFGGEASLAARVGALLGEQLSVSRRYWGGLVEVVCLAKMNTIAGCGGGGGFFRDHGQISWRRHAGPAVRDMMFVILPRSAKGNPDTRSAGVYGGEVVERTALGPFLDPCVNVNGHGNMAGH